MRSLDHQVQLIEVRDIVGAGGGPPAPLQAAVMWDTARVSSVSCNIVQAAVNLGSSASLSGAGPVRSSKGQEQAAAYQAGRLEGLAPPEQILHQCPHNLQLHHCCQAPAALVAV